MSIFRVMIAISFLLVGMGSAAAASHVALVIGNSVYDHAQELKNAVSDANKIAAALRELGFEVALKKNLNRVDFVREIDVFSGKSEAAEIALIFFAGHGIPYRGQDRVIPIDAKLRKEIDITRETVEMKRLVEAASQAKRLGAVFMDVARVNPFRKSSPFLEEFKSWQSNTGGSLAVGFATEFGSLAYDGDGKNSPYAKALLRHLTKKNPTIIQLLKSSRNVILADERQEQKPVYHAINLQSDIPLLKPVIENRVALIIGNNDYKHPWPDLENPVNDANAMAVKLRELGFGVTQATDATRFEMEDAIQTFARESKEADVALVFFAGHGVQHNGINYLVPVDGKLTDETDLRRYILVSDILYDLQQSKGAKILILDACRDDEVFAYLDSLPKTRSLAKNRGLAEEKAEGVLIAFAAQPDKLAADALPGTSNSPFTSALLNHIGTPNIELRTMLTRVRAEVYLSTKQTQLPETSDSMIGEFHFVAN